MFFANVIRSRKNLVLEARYLQHLHLLILFFLNWARGVRTPNSTTPKNYNIKFKSQVPTAIPLIFIGTVSQL